MALSDEERALLLKFLKVFDIPNDRMREHRLNQLAARPEPMAQVAVEVIAERYPDEHLRHLAQQILAQRTPSPLSDVQIDVRILEQFSLNWDKPLESAEIEAARILAGRTAHPRISRAEEVEAPAKNRTSGTQLILILSIVMLVFAGAMIGILMVTSPPGTFAVFSNQETTQAFIERMWIEDTTGDQVHYIEYTFITENGDRVTTTEAVDEKRYQQYAPSESGWVRYDPANSTRVELLRP